MIGGSYKDNFLPWKTFQALQDEIHDRHYYFYCPMVHDLS